MSKGKDECYHCSEWDTGLLRNCCGSHLARALRVPLGPTPTISQSMATTGVTPALLPTCSGAFSTGGLSAAGLPLAACLLGAALVTRLFKAAQLLFMALPNGAGAVKMVGTAAACFLSLCFLTEGAACAAVACSETWADCCLCFFLFFACLCAGAAAFDSAGDTFETSVRAADGAFLLVPDFIKSCWTSCLGAGFCWPSFAAGLSVCALL